MQIPWTARKTHGPRPNPAASQPHLLATATPGQLPSIILEQMELEHAHCKCLFFQSWRYEDLISSVSYVHHIWSLLTARLQPKMCVVLVLPSLCIVFSFFLSEMVMHVYYINPLCRSSFLLVAKMHSTACRSCSISECSLGGALVLFFF